MIEEFINVNLLKQIKDRLIIEIRWEIVIKIHIDVARDAQNQQ